MSEKQSKLIADQDEVLRFLTAVMRGEEKDEKVVINIAGDVIRLEARKQAHQLEAAEMLAKRYGLLIDKTEADVDVELNISVDYGDSK